MNPVDRIGALFAGPGAEDYLGEAVTQAEHMLQAAALASAAGAPTDWSPPRCCTTSGTSTARSPAGT